jgi:hypothetical protein
MKNNPYSDLYNGYFDVRDPYTTNLDEIYQKPVSIPIYSPHEIFTDHALDDHYAAIALSKELEMVRQDKIHDVNLVYSLQRKLRSLNDKIESRDLDIFKYFHFIAARSFKQEMLKAAYRAYAHAKQVFVRQGDTSAQAHTDHQYYKKLLLDLQCNLEEERKIAILNAY